MAHNEPVELADIASLLRAFETHGVQYVLVGSMAMAAQGLIRATQDVDLFVKVDPENVDRLRAALRDVFHDDSVDETTDDLAGSYPVLRYGPAEPNGFLTDIIGRLGDVHSYDDIDSDLLDIDGTNARVATPSMLYRMKRDTGAAARSTGRREPSPQVRDRGVTAVPVTKYRSIEDVPAPAPRQTPGENLRLAFALSKTCLALAHNGAGLAAPEGEQLPSGRVWRSRGPQVGPARA